MASAKIRRRRDGKIHYLLARGELLGDGRIHVHAMDSQGSHLLRSLSESNALIELPDGEGCVAGDLVQLVVLDAESLLMARSLETRMPRAPGVRRSGQPGIRRAGEKCESPRACSP